METKSVVNGDWKKQNVLLSHESNEKVVTLERTQTIYIFHILILLSFALNSIKIYSYADIQEVF